MTRHQSVRGVVLGFRRTVAVAFQSPSPPPADLSDLELVGSEQRLEQLDRERQDRAQHVRIQRATVGERPSEDPPASWRFCQCEGRAVIDSADPESGCFTCGRPLRDEPPTSGEGSGDEPLPWSTEDEAELRELVRGGDRTAFQVGDAALRLVPMSHTKANGGQLALVRQLAGRVGVEFSTMRRYRSVAAAWPPGTRVAEATYGAHVAWTVGGPTRAVDRANALRVIAAAAPGGTATAEAVRTHRRRTVPAGAEALKLLDRLRRLAADIARDGDQLAELDAAMLRRRAVQARAIADRLDALARD
jgi:hypothetical protein